MTLTATLNQSQLQNLCENYLETPLLIKGSIDRSNIKIYIKPYVHEEKGQFRRMLQIKVKFKQEIWTARATDVKNNGQRTCNLLFIWISRGCPVADKLAKTAVR